MVIRGFFEATDYIQLSEDMVATTMQWDNEAKLAEVAESVTSRTTPMRFPIVQVDAFANRPFAGNPAAVCVLPQPVTADWMQSVAREMNLSETAFLLHQIDGYNLRWFTPTVEVDLCGHATLASAHVLWEEGHWPLDETIRFYTRSGLLTAQRQGDWIELDFPAKPAEVATAPPSLEKALGVNAVWVGKNNFDYLVEIGSPEVLRSLQPDFPLLRTLNVRGVIVTCASDHPDYDFLSRFFAPGSGIDEDPVTGSAHCCLGPFWRDRLQKDELLGFQASQRGGAVRVRCVDDRVLLGGQAVSVLKGELLG